MRKILWSIVYLLVFAFGIGVAALAFRSWVDYFAVVSGTTARGRIVDCRFGADQVKNRGRGKIDVDLEYRFEHEGKTYDSDRYYSDGGHWRIDAAELGDAQRRYAKNAPVEVRFDPKDPKRSALTSWPSPIMWLGFVLVLLLCGAPIYAAIRRARGSTDEPILEPQLDMQAALERVRLPRAELEPLVARCEEEFAVDPERYRRKLLWFARTIPITLAGTGLVLISVAVWLAISATANDQRNTFKGAFLLGAIGLWSMRMLLLRDRPIVGGVRLVRSQAPKLFAQVDELVERANSDPIHEVIVDSSLNAAIVSRARMGLFGLWRNSLIVGLRLMASMPPEEFRSVLAHEIGHLSARDGIATRSIYRLRAYWSRVMSATFSQRRSAKDPFVRFLFRFIARFEARSLVLGRRQELRADAIAVETVGPRTAADALVRLHHVEELEQRLYDETLTTRIRTMPTPPEDPLEFVRAISQTPIEPLECHRRLRVALDAKTDPYDTHPSLADRIAAIRVAPRIAPAFEEDAATALLEGESKRIARETFAEWTKSLAEFWEANHELWRLGNTRCEELRSRSTRSAGEEFELARLVEERESASAALAHYDAAARLDPGHRASAFHAARIRLESGDLTASDAILAVAALDPDFATRAHAAIARCLEKLGRSDDAREWERRSDEEAAEDRRAVAEREATTLADDLAPHDLDSDTRSTVTKALREIPDLREVFIARKVLRHRPHRPYFVVGLTSARVSARWFMIGREAESRRLVDAALEALADSGFKAHVFGLDAQPARLRKRLQRVAGSRFEVSR